MRGQTMKGLLGNRSLKRLSRLSLIACALILFAIVLVYSPTAFGQGATGAINGTVADSSGADIPSARVTLRNAATGAERTALTNPTGTYVIPGAIPGTYTMQVGVQEFTDAKAEALTF